MYINIRCRKCGQYLSMETDDPYKCRFGYLFDKKHHNCPSGIADDEKIFCDLISKSDNPIGEVIVFGDKNKEEPITPSLDTRYREMYKLDYKVPCGKRYICEYKDCSLCQSPWRCMAGLNADEFEIASKEELIDRLINNKCTHGRPYTEEEKATMKKVLKEFYDYEFDEEEKEK